MPLNLASPGIVVKEVDLTIGRVDPTAEGIGAIVGPFEKGTVNEPVLINNEQELLNTFGSPYATDNHYETWLVASSYLAYGGALQVVRSDDSDLKNAFAGSGSAPKIRSYEDYVKYIIHHNVDMLMPEKKLILISHMYSKVRENNKMSELEQEIKSYLDANMITHKNKGGFLMIDTKNWKLYIQSSENSQQWEEAEPEDVRNFEISGSLASKMKVESAQYSKIIGFIDMFRNGKEMVFRIKDTTQMQNNTGTRINSQTPGKGDIIKRLNEIVHDGETVTEPMYNLTKSKEIMQQGLCVIVELLLFKIGAGHLKFALFKEDIKLEKKGRSSDLTLFS